MDSYASRKAMGNAKVDVYIPLGQGPDAIEVIADTNGCQLNIIVEGNCEFRLNINKLLELKLVEHPADDKILYEANLEKLYYEK